MVHCAGSEPAVIAAGSLQNTTTAPPANDTESGSNAEYHQTRALPPVCPWRLDIVRTVLLGTHDAQSPLCQLRSQHRLLELISRGWAWPEVLVNSARLWAPELFLDVLIAEMLEASPGAVTETELRERLKLNPDGYIASWNLSYCRLRAFPELFGAVTTTGDLYLYENQLRSLPDSFGLITVGGNLELSYNQLTSLPASFGSIIVGGNLWLSSNQLSSLPASFVSITVGGNLSLYYNELTSLPASFGAITVGGNLGLGDNQLQDQDIPAAFPNVGGDVHK